MQQVTPDESQNLFSGVPSASEGGGGIPSPMHDGATSSPSPNDQTIFYIQEDEQGEDDDLNGQSSPFVSPFQNSGSMSTVVQGGAPEAVPPAAPPSQAQSGSFRLLKFLLIGGAVAVTLLVFTIVVLAQSATPQAPEKGHGTLVRTVTAQTPSPQQKQPRHPTPAPKNNATPAPTPSGSGGTQGNQNTPNMSGPGAPTTGDIPTMQVLGQIGWAQAGLSTGDAVEALRTARTFVDREMSYDYRNIGTPGHHAGTITGAVFLLTSGAQSRFMQNDVRAINNVLYDKVINEHIIQQALISQVQLTKFQVVPVQGQIHRFVWITVSFQLWQSKIDGNTGQRTQGMELDPNTQQPRTHQMTVLLIRVPPQQQGANAPMGGTGWLVNTYALDAATPPDIATDPTL